MSLAPTSLPGEVTTTVSVPLVAQPCRCDEGPFVIIRGEECIRCGRHPQIRLTRRQREKEARWQRRRAKVEADERAAVKRGLEVMAA